MKRTTDHDRIETLVRKIRRDRKLTLVLAPLGIAYFGFKTWLNLRWVLAHIDAVAEARLPASSSPDMIRMTALHDSISIAGRFGLISLSLAMVAVFVFCLIVPDQKGKLLLALAEELTKEADQPPPAGDVVKAAPEE